MYKIIGEDGREYGPVNADQLRQWIREGRANAQTKAQAEGSADWKPISAFPELSNVAGGPFPAPGIPPLGGPAEAVALADRVMARSHEVDIGSCISRAWELLKNNFWRLVGTSLLIFLLVGGVGGALRFIVNMVFGTQMLGHSPAEVGLLGALQMQWRGILVNILWNMFMAGPLLGGLYNYYLKLIRGQTAMLGDAFAGFSGAFLPLTTAHIISGILTGLGFLCCAVPGVYLGVAWKFTLPLVIDKRMGFWDAMELSRKAATRQWWSLFALFLLSGLISASGLIVCCIGVLGTVPIGIAAILYAYEDIFGSQTTAQAG